MDAQTEEERATLQPAVVSINVGAGGRGAPAGAAPVTGADAGAQDLARGGRGAVPHDAAASPESRLVGAPVQTRS